MRLALATVAAAITLMATAGCSTTDSCCCCYYVDAALNGECDIFSAEELGATAANPCGVPENYPERYGYQAFACGSNADSMSVASQYQAAADACFADLESQ